MMTEEVGDGAGLWVDGGTQYHLSSPLSLHHVLNTRNKFPKEGFPKFNDFPSDFGWTKKPRFWGNE
jgi:hypothetical protein